MKRGISRFSALSMVFVLISALCFLVFSLASFPLARADLTASSGNSYAIIVGVSNYKYVTDLTYCYDDAIDLNNSLAPVWGVNNVKLLTDAAGNKTAIHDAIFDWLSPIENVNDTVLFFFSGHGGSDTDIAPIDEADGKDEYICPYDSLTSSWANDIRDDELDTWLNVLDSRKIVVILDTCDAGGFINNRGTTKTDISKTVAIEADPKLNGLGDGFSKDLSKDWRVIMAACAENESSWDSGILRNGVFSYYVIEAFCKLNIADVNANNEISAEEIFNYAEPKSIAFSTQNCSKVQHPKLYDGYAGELPVLMTATITFNTTPPAASLVVDGVTYSRSQLPKPFVWAKNTTHSFNASLQAYEINEESPHPYSNNCNSTWNITRANTASIRVHFSYIRTERNYDYIRVLDNAGNICASYTGNYTDFWSPWIPGNTTRIRLTSDFSGVYDGFLVDNLEHINSSGETTQEYARYIFSSWTDGNTSISRTLTVIESQTVTATYSTEYYLTVNSPYGSEGGGGWYPNGTITCATLTNGTIDYQNGTRRLFMSWSGDATGTNFMSCDLICMNVSKTIAANWKTQYYLNASTPYGTVNGTGWYDSGTNAKVVLPNGVVSNGTGTQYVFTSWGGDASGTSLTSNNITMNNPKTATTNWKTQYFFNVSSAFGTTSGSGWYDRNALVTANVSQMTVSGAVGVQCVFTSWSGATTGNGISSNSILMDNPKNVTANWKIQFQVSFASNPSAAGALSPSADTWTDAESSIPISATASSGYTFAFWSAPNGITITNPQASGTTASVTAPGTLTANFAVQSQSSSSSSQSSSSSSEASSSPSPSTPSQAQPKRGNLIIYVKDSGNNPVEGVTIVFASQPEGQVSLSATTNSSGYVTLCNVTAGSYSLQASKNGYIKNIVQTTAQTGKDTSAAIELQSETISPPSQPIEFGQIIAIVSAVAAFSVIGLFFIKRRKNK